MRIRSLVSSLALAAMLFVPAVQVFATGSSSFTVKVITSYSSITVYGGGSYYELNLGAGCNFTNPPDLNAVVSVNSDRGYPKAFDQLTYTAGGDSCVIWGATEVAMIPYTLTAAGTNGATATIVSQETIPVYYNLTFNFGCSQLASVLNGTVYVRQSGQLNGSGDSLYLFAQDQNCSITTASIVYPTLQYSLTSGTVLESAGTAAIAVQLNRAYPSAVSATYTTVAGTATAADYTASTGTVTVAAGATTAVVSVPITADSIDEADEAFTLTLSSPSNATLGAQTTFTLTIQDDDVTPTPTPSTPTITNVVAKSGKASVTINGLKKTLQPYAASYKGGIWAKKVVLAGEAHHILVATDPYKLTTIKFYNEDGKLLQSLKPFGLYAINGVSADIITQPSSGKVYLAIAFKKNGYSVRVYEVTDDGLQAVANVAASTKAAPGNILVGFRKVYGTDYGLTTMVSGKSSTLKVWKYNEAKNTWLRDSTKSTLAKLKVSGNKVVLK